MIRGLTRAGLGNIESNEQYITNAAKYGFQSVDLNPLSFIEEVGKEQAKHLLESNQVIIGSSDLTVDWRTTDEQFREGLQSLVQMAEAAASLNCYSCCTYILPSTDQPAASFMAAATKRLRLCADILDAYGIRLGLEFVGCHHLRTQWKNPFIWSVGDTLDWIETIHAPNVGLLVDSYHWHTNGLAIEEVLNLKKEQVVHVHINDAYDLPIEELLDYERLYPGEGVIDLPGFLKNLKAIGYTGVVSQEVLAPTPTLDSSELFAKSKASFDSVFAEI
ncbi:MULTISPECIES: sugar phosphate isomerase/epimerase family protein [unclassified Paenibacillus]|uniref:sugar phosphate isomerase/epimerase family protein n=1 Tax=unclassified Paenibacillus TaxID=185978 RepID=UPI00040EE4C2|nr:MULTISPECIES: sugar phosphate isomerase/epimerase family protein [unclassified Paenibacillus]KGP85154.1 xylose isomerase [Paenibacillus sp. MAEPY2]KGP88183.1 xylose isomerase [Paenibacillus sp. MAEPY1]